MWYGTLMKPKHIFTVLTLVIITALAVLFLNGDPNNIQSNSEDWALSDGINSSTTTTSTENAEVEQKISSPITLLSLQAREDWNPTTEVEGMVRVEDNISELQVQEYPTHTEENSGFVLKYLEQTVTEEACTEHHLSNTEGYRCYEASPELFNELIVLSKDTGEVLHKYKLNKGYSLINTKYAIEGEGVFIEEIDSEEYTIIGIYINKWDSYNTQTNSNGQIEYYFNLETGEITRE